MKKICIFLLVMMCASVAIADVVWIDVRSAEEYAEDHIEGDIRISHEEIVAGVEKLFTDKNTEIHLYCRSGLLRTLVCTYLRSYSMPQEAI